MYMKYERIRKTKEFITQKKKRLKDVNFNY
jgi:hypothetical protein